MKLFRSTQEILGWLRYYVCVIGVLLAGYAATGCATYHVYQKGGPNMELGRQPATYWHTQRMDALAWGLVRADLPTDKCVLADGTRVGFEELKIETNILATILTLGIWMPIEVSYRCAKPPPPSGEL
jgi:hypothetical protein